MNISEPFIQRPVATSHAGSPLGAPPAIWAAIRKQSGLAEKIILPGDRVATAAGGPGRAGHPVPAHGRAVEA